MVPGAGQQPRELTAEQLAGGAIPGRRRRGPGSATASMRSTRSLPLYMKEPGEQEVVVFRAEAEIGADGSVRASMLLPPVAEGRERTLDADMDMRRTSVSSFAGPDTPLLDGLSEQQSPSATPSPQPPHQQPRMRPSLETMGGGSSEAEEPLMEGARAQEEREREQEEHERGPAPPYVEAVSRDSGVAFDSTEDGHASPATTSLPPASARRSSSGRRPGILGRAESAVSVLDPHNGRLSHLLHIFQPGQRQAATSEPTALPMPTPAPESPRPSGEQPSPPRRDRKSVV